MTPDLPLAAAANGGCSCNCGAEPADPVFDARVIPHAVRHGAVFGALDSIAPGSALVLVAPHDPKPLLAQAHDRYDGALAVEYLQRGPDEWRLRLVRA
ncbi:MAG: DUF2249 domain-containing protein [Candidatus Nanopelagicales bacterium]